ncbi:hypothetical protein [Paenibacillus ihumii]|uniref:hypothetical protein n=1 Tax=Paenibacillus ihumii TaxID=687436 RepID=UPI0006D7B4BC|nr:hypothetical protein [Paenibacillus ihumii]
MYAIYDHELYMGYAYEFAEQQREKLTKLGVSEEWYTTGIRLAEFYKGSPLDACDYNPLKQNMSVMPKESELLDEYNQAIPAEDIRKMQQYLKNMNIYHGEVIGEYNQEFLVAVAGYQHIANTVSTMAAVRREWFGLEMFE